MNGTMRAFVEYYDMMGWSVIPIEPGGKRPWFEGLPSSGWGVFAQQRSDRRHWEEWWGDDERVQPSIGVITGQVSGGLMVLDLDVRGVYDKLTAAWPELSDTLTATTGKGYHLYFHPEEQVIGGIGTTSFDLDGYRHHVKGENGYVVAPPSMHANGNQYAFLPGQEVKTYSLERLTQVIQDCGGVASRSSGDRIARSEDWFSEYYAGVYPKGERNDALAKVAQTLRNVMSRWGWDQYAMDIMLDWNQRHCDPPLPEREVQSIVDGTRRYSAWLPPEDIGRQSGQWT